MSNPPHLSGKDDSSTKGKARGVALRGGQGGVDTVKGGQALREIVSGEAHAGVPAERYPAQPEEKKLPNASMVYGIGASVLVVLALGLLFNGLWFTAILVLLSAGCFLGFALHYIRVDSSREKPYG